MKLFPVETVHVCMALASCGITTSPYLSMIISEFVKLLPKDEISLAIVYLAFTGDRRILVDFLLSQDICRKTVNLSVPGKEGAEDLIREECDENRLSISTLQVLLVCGYYENAVSVFSTFLKTFLVCLLLLPFPLFVCARFFFLRRLLLTIALVCKMLAFGSLFMRFLSPASFHRANELSLLNQLRNSLCPLKIRDS